VASDVVGAERREAATGRMVDLGFVYPDALDIRSALPNGFSHVPVRSPASHTSGARPRPGPADEPTAAQP
jgi:hypothetical protein